MWQVLDYLFLATDADVRDLELLRANRITHIVNCAVELVSHHPQEFDYLRLELSDPDDGLRDCINEACEYIEVGRKSGNVAVHCMGAVSRSPAVVLSYLCHLGRSPREAATQLAGVVPTRPNDVFLKQIAEYYGQPDNPRAIADIVAVLTHGRCL